MNRWLELARVKVPIVQAPMAGGPDTPALAAAVSEAGGLGSLGCAYLTPAQIEAAVAAVRGQPVAVNLFMRADPPPDEAANARVVEALKPLRRELGLPETPAPLKALPSVEDQLATVLRLRPRVFSFTFGMPAPEQLAALRAAGIVTVGTATSLEEGEALEALGVDAIVAQGSEAGGHRGTFIADALVGTLVLTRMLVARLKVPVLAAGGIMDGAGIRAALDLGAAAACLGTAFMLCPEAGTHPAHRRALRSEAARHTVVTRAFTGRAARGIRNGFTTGFDVEPAAFPYQQALTAEVRTAAATQGETDLMQLWAGQGAALIRELPARELFARLVDESALK